MKSILYAIAVASIGAASFFGWSVKDKYSEKLAARNELRQQNDNFSARTSALERQIVDRAHQSVTAPAENSSKAARC